MNLDASPWTMLTIGDCWTFTGKARSGKSRNPGYGAIRYQGRFYQAHRLIYELLVGPIAPGLVLDHMCLNTLCCNPDHLDPVTRAENNRRALLGRSHMKTHCPQGHPYDANNSRFRPYDGARVCRTCEHDYRARRL